MRRKSLLIVGLVCLVATGFLYKPVRIASSASEHKKAFIRAAEAHSLPEMEKELQAIHESSNELLRWKVPTFINDYFFKDLILYEAEYLLKIGDYRRILELFPTKTPENCEDYRVCHLLGTAHFSLIQDLQEKPLKYRIDKILEQACPYFEAALRNDTKQTGSLRNFHTAWNYDMCTPENIVKILMPPEELPDTKAPGGGSQPGTPPPARKP